MDLLLVSLSDGEAHRLMELSPGASNPEDAAHNILQHYLSSYYRLESLYESSDVESLVMTYVRMLELADYETVDHAKRVASLTMRLASQFDFSDHAMVDIHRGALLHDIGKIVIPDHILHKKDPLTEEEQAAIHRHPDYARIIIEPFTPLRSALPIPLYHHERFDGSGYPYGKSGEDIPLSARVFAVVDVWDALFHERGYAERAWSAMELEEYFRHGSGSQFDPAVLEKFFPLIPEFSTRNLEDSHELV